MIWELLGSGTFLTAAGWVVRTEATKTILDSHIKEDDRLHEDIRERLIRLEDKLDRVIEKRPRA